jgi:hypothetical protein
MGSLPQTANLSKLAPTIKAILFIKVSKLPRTRSQSFRKLMRLKEAELVKQLESQTFELSLWKFSMALAFRLESRPISLTSPCLQYPIYSFTPTFLDHD